VRLVETPDFIDPEPAPSAPRDPYRQQPSPRPVALWPGLGERLTWVTGLVLLLSALTGWYTGSGDGLHIAVIGWHTGVLGKLVFFIGFALIVLTVMAELGMELPAAVPESLVVIALGALATIFVLIRLISIPEDLLPADGRGIGLYISLVAALAAIAAGIVRASEEL
jgi:hypothetical protein